MSTLFRKFGKGFRLIYQTLICFRPLAVGQRTGGLESIGYAKNPQSLANALVHRMFRDAETTCNLLAGHILRDQTQAVLLLVAQRGHLVQNRQPFARDP